MPAFVLPDGKVLEFDQPVSGRAIAERIGPGLAKKAIAIKVNDEIRDLDRIISDHAKISIITASNDNTEALAVLRHSCAHVLAEAICSLWPQTKLAYGPSIDEGFFYDMAIVDGAGERKALTDADFAAIEDKMREIVKADRPFTRCEFSPRLVLERLRHHWNFRNFSSEPLDQPPRNFAGNDWRCTIQDSRHLLLNSCSYSHT